MDINEIRSKLSSLQQKPGKKGEKKESKQWKPTIGKQVIRILPSKFNKKNPFSEVYFYYNIGNKVMISPLSWGEKDPIAEFVKQLRSSSNKENWQLAKKLDPKMRVFVPVIVRGEEDKGVRLWQFGKETYMELLSMAEDEDIGDYTDINEGRDITVDTVGPEVTGTAYNKSTVRAKTKQTPIAESKEYIKKFLEEQPNPIDEYKHYSFDEMKAALQSFLTPEEEETEEDGIIDDEKELSNDLPWEGDKKESSDKKYSFKAPSKPQNKADKFDALFEED